MSDEVRALRGAVTALEKALLKSCRAQEGEVDSPPSMLTLRAALYAHCYAVRLSVLLASHFSPAAQTSSEVVMRCMSEAAWLDACQASSMYERFVAKTKGEGV